METGSVTSVQQLQYAHCITESLKFCLFPVVRRSVCREFVVVAGCEVPALLYEEDTAAVQVQLAG
jgi:hypothetical protein